MSNVTTSMNNNVIVKEDNNNREEMNLNVQLNRWILKSIGAWPKSFNISYKQIFLHRLSNVICYGLIIFLMIPCGLYLSFEVKDTYDKIRLTGPLSFCLMAIIKYCALTLRENDIRRCLDYIELDWKQVRHLEDIKIMKNNANIGRRIVIICAIFMYSSAAFYYIAVPFAKGLVIEDDTNLTYRPLVYPVARIIVDARRTPINQIFFGIQCVSGFIAHSITAGACGLAATFAMHACGQLQVITICLKNLIDGRQDSFDTVEQRLADIIQRHVRALNFISLTEEVLNEISLVEVVGCTLNICLLGYYCITGWQYNETMGRVTYIILFISVTFNIFIFCYIGELLAEQCQKVGECSYMIDWYRLPWKNIRSLVLIIATSNSSKNLTAGYLIELSLTSFGDVIKSSLAYLNMLRTLTE
ncbi:PREDICTED: odorant receptor 13a-like [Polistes dominula]|uniref:Odorant receptor n=1 Tax=Polistes dominula TaxID=743375 RepID=A0ABM1IGI4_POLDO|nr:PREDICTED: odorant receptor 13a-like [Polistes dominula]